MGFDKTPRDRLEQAIRLAMYDDIDRTGTILEAILARPEDVIALLGGEQVTYAFLQGDNVWRFPREEKP